MRYKRLKRIMQHSSILDVILLFREVGFLVDLTLNAKENPLSFETMIEYNGFLTGV